MQDEEKKKDNARRQAEYRKRRLKDGSDQRLNVILSLQARQALDMIAQHYGTTNKAAVERVLLEAQAQLDQQITDDQQRGGDAETSVACQCSKSANAKMQLRWRQGVGPSRAFYCLERAI